jgi:hypothetical protein
LSSWTSASVLESQRLDEILAVETAGDGVAFDDESRIDGERMI